MLKYLDKPRVPEDLVEEMKESVVLYKKERKLSEGDVVSSGLSNPVLPKNPLGYRFDEAPKGGEWCSTFSYIPISHRVSDWVRENLTPVPTCSFLILMSGGSAVWPHIDDFRSSAWNYVITPSSASLCYYEAKKEYEHLTQCKGMYVPIERVNKVEEMEIERDKWYEFESTRIHGVENIKGERLVLSVSFGMPEEFLSQ